MISIKKLVMIDSPEIMEQKLEAYAQYVLMGSGDGEFSNFSQLANYFNEMQNIAFDLNEKESFIVTSKDDMDYLESVFNKINLKFKMEDYSSKYFDGTLNIETFLSSDKEKIDNVFLSVLTVDDVLDKIRVGGEDSLNYLDKLVLKNF
jgi:hypothetical protein